MIVEVLKVIAEDKASPTIKNITKEAVAMGVISEDSAKKFTKKLENMVADFAIAAPAALAAGVAAVGAAVVAFGVKSIAFAIEHDKAMSAAASGNTKLKEAYKSIAGQLGETGAKALLTADMLERINREAPKTELLTAFEKITKAAGDIQLSFAGWLEDTFKISRLMTDVSLVIDKMGGNIGKTETDKVRAKEATALAEAEAAGNERLAQSIIAVAEARGRARVEPPAKVMPTPQQMDRLSPSQLNADITRRQDAANQVVEVEREVAATRERLALKAAASTLKEAKADDDAAIALKRRGEAAKAFVAEMARLEKGMNDAMLKLTKSRDQERADEIKAALHGGAQAFDEDVEDDDKKKANALRVATLKNDSGALTRAEKDRQREGRLAIGADLDAKEHIAQQRLVSNFQAAAIAGRNFFNVVSHGGASAADVLQSLASLVLSIAGFFLTPGGTGAGIAGLLGSLFGAREGGTMPAFAGGGTGRARSHGGIGIGDVRLGLFEPGEVTLPKRAGSPGFVEEVAEAARGMSGGGGGMTVHATFNNLAPPNSSEVQRTFERGVVANLNDMQDSNRARIQNRRIIGRSFNRQ